MTNLHFPDIKPLIQSLWKSANVSKSKSLGFFEQVAFLLLIRRVPEWKASIFEKEIPYDRYKQYELIRSALHDITKNYWNINPELRDYFQKIPFNPESVINLRICIDTIEKIYKKTEHESNTALSYYDIDGMIYDEMITHLDSIFPKGQFYMPRHIVKFMTKLVNPVVGEKVMDPACEAGGFLVSAHQNMMANLTKRDLFQQLPKDEDGFEHALYTKELCNDYQNNNPYLLKGNESNEDLVRLAHINLLLRGVDATVEKVDLWYDQFWPEHKFDVILANPPFNGTTEDPNYNYPISSNKKEVQLIDRASRSLAHKGRAAIIVPENFLTNSGNDYKECRKRLLLENKMEAVISLPAGIFNPHTAGKSAILVFTKADSTQKVWFYELQNDGYSLDKKRRKLKNTYPLADAVKLYENRAQSSDNRTEQAFFVSIDTIEKKGWQLAYNCYREMGYERQQFEAPEKILQDIMTGEERILEDLKEITRLMSW